MNFQQFILIGLLGCTDKTEEPSTEDSSSNLPLDTDGDGLSDVEETEWGSDPEQADSDGDGLGDAAEKEWGTDPNNVDTDNDNLSDLAETEGGTNPTNADTDGDGAEDGFEREYNTDPTDPADFPLFPNNGDWSHQNPQFTNDECNLETVLQEQGGNIFTFFPQDFTLSNSSPDEFLLTIEQSTLCSITDLSFQCVRISDFVPLNTPNVTLELEFGMDGYIMDTESMNFEVEVRLMNCDGGIIACGLLSLAGINIPCSTFITTHASP
jgi:hypothetical protein